MRKILVLAAVAAGIAGSAQAADITGAGATFPFPIYSKWAEAYQKATGTGLNYQSIGSGGGIRQIKAKTVAFGASDAPLKGEDLTKDGLVQFPTVMGGVVPAVNIAGVEPGKLKLSGDVLAGIYMGEIKKWNDPKIVALNGDLKLPDANINPVYRSDGSGTTFVFTDYLSKVSAEWKSKIGNNTSVQWPVGIGGKGNEGVSASVKQVANSIGYVEYAYAKQNNLTYTDLINKEGKKVEPTDASFSAAAANADWSSQPGYGVILANQPGAETWPMTAATWILVYKQPEDATATAEALKFFAWSYEKGGEMAAELDYVPMPDSVVKSVEAMWTKDIVGSDGKPLYTGM